MDWLVDLFQTESVAHTVLVLMLVSSIGLALGRIRVGGVSLGIAWVMFTGIVFGHFGLGGDHTLLHFVREFGLILFVFTIGMQVGPSFFATLRRNGLPLNLAAAGVVGLGVAIAVAQWAWFMGSDPGSIPAAVGLLSGATTNTPSMASGIAAVDDLARRGGAVADFSGGATIGSAYAIAYPLGILGVLLTMIAVRAVFRVDLAHERQQLAARQGHDGIDVLNLEVQNPSLAGRRIRDVPTLSDSGVAITRLLRGGAVQLAAQDATLQVGDILTAVGPAPALAQIEIIVGPRTTVDARAVPSDIGVRVVLVSNSNAVGKTINELALREKYGVVLTRIHRAGFELPVTPASRLQFGDRVAAVGDNRSMDSVVQELGDSMRALDKPILGPILLGIALGVIFGSIPIALPGLPAPLKLGLAGGPLVVAILLSRLYRVGPLIWYMPAGANYMLREIGIVLFLACVGLLSGGDFVETFRTHGAQWLLIGALITIVPVAVVGFIARGVFKMNYITLTGLLAGSMTDPPALAFAQSLTGSETPTVSYATVYPLVMLLRVMSTQLIVLLLMG